jgi:hypothetical protein
MTVAVGTWFLDSPQPGKVLAVLSYVALAALSPSPSRQSMPYTSATG